MRIILWLSWWDTSKGRHSRRVHRHSNPKSNYLFRLCFGKTHPIPILCTYIRSNHFVADAEVDLRLWAITLMPVSVSVRRWTFLVHFTYTYYYVYKINKKWILFNMPYPSISFNKYTTTLIVIKLQPVIF